MNFPEPGTPCIYCPRVAGDWNDPCATSPDGLHWTATGPGSREEWALEKLASTARSLSRACLELEKVANALDELPPRARRRLRRQHDLIPDVIRNEAERGRDTLHVYGLLDL